MEASSENFRKTMRGHAGAIGVVTVAEQTSRTGFVATSISSFSADPPRLLFSIDRGSSSWAALRRVKLFGVSFLSEVHAPVANRFAGADGEKGSDRYLGVEWLTLPSGVHLLTNALGALECEVEETIDRYDHSILLARVLSVRINDDGEPLLWFKGKYHRLGTML